MRKYSFQTNWSQQIIESIYIWNKYCNRSIHVYIYIYIYIYTKLFTPHWIRSNNENKANRRDLIAAIGVLIWTQIIDFAARVSLKFDGWPTKTIGHLLYTKSSFVRHFNSGNAQFRSKLSIFVPCDFDIWWMTLKNNRAPLLYYIKLVHHFKSIGGVKRELQSRNAPLGSKLVIILSRVTLKFDRWPCKRIGHLFYKLWASFQSHW